MRTFTVQGTTKIIKKWLLFLKGDMSDVQVEHVWTCLIGWEPTEGITFATLWAGGIKTLIQFFLIWSANAAQYW